MHRMTRELGTTSVRAPFDGEVHAFKGDTAMLEERDGARFMRLVAGGEPERLFRVTKVIGGRHREDFAGVEVRPDAPLGAPLDEERVLPLSYLVFSGEFRYKGYSVMVGERAGLEPGLVWKQTCIFCHNTVPMLATLYDELHGPGPHAPSYQGSASTELPPDKAFRYRVTDDAALFGALGRELGALGVQGRLPSDAAAALEVASDVTRERFGEEHLVELGIGCEACHGGAREHADHPGAAVPTFELVSDAFDVESPSGAVPTHAEDVNRTCEKCHTVLFSRYPYTWEGRTRKSHPGGSTTNSGEARDFLLGGCSKALACTSCHDPHTEDKKADLDALAGPRGDRLCTSCHETYRGPDAMAAHSHHPAGRSGPSCIDCHMPKKNMGLEYGLVRYHRIGSPTDEERVTGDRPLECALCHADRSVDQIVTTMERFWKKKYDRRALRRLYGDDLRVKPLDVTLLGGRPHERAVAAAAAAAHGRVDLLPRIVAVLDDDYPLVRYYARAAAEQLLGERLPLDMSASGAETRAAAERFLAERRPSASR